MEESTEDDSEVPAETVQPRRKKLKRDRTYSSKKHTNSYSNIDDNLESDSSEKNGANVSVLKLKKKPDGRRDYSKKHFCFFCPTSCHKMARHLVRKHSNELEVAKAMSFPLTSKERRLQFDLLRNKGNRAHNNKVIQSGIGTLVPSQQASAPVKPSDYIHRINCEALLKRKTLWRHMSRCKPSKKCSTQQPGRSRIQSLCTFAQPTPEGVNQKLGGLINAMHQDDVTPIRRQEKTILRLGENLYAKHGHDKSKHEYIRQKMREIGRLHLHSRRVGKLKKMKDFFKPANFNLVVETVKVVCGFDEDRNSYKTPSLALKLGHSLKKIADVLECEAQMRECSDEELIENVKRTRNLFEKKWDICVSSHALQTLREAKWNAPQLLQFTEDVKKNALLY